MVTRTIMVNLVKVMCVNVPTAEVVTNTYEIIGKADNILDAVKALAETDEFKVVSVLETETIEKLYGMTESEFVKYGRVLPPRTAQETQE